MNSEPHTEPKCEAKAGEPRCDEATGTFGKYADRVIGNRSLADLIWYELLMWWLQYRPGCVGLFLRRKLYGGLFRSLGSDAIIGVGVSLRQPGKMTVGRGCVIEDLAHLGARGSDKAAIRLHDHVLIGRGAILNARNGEIDIGEDSSIGGLARIACTNGTVTIGRHVLVAGYSYIGCCGHKMDKTDVPMMLQGPDTKGGVTIGDDVWIGAGAVVLDGVTIGKGSVIGASSLVTHDIPEYSVAFGTPAEVRRKRT